MSTCCMNIVCVAIFDFGGLIRSYYFVFKSALFEIQSINIAANNYLLCEDIEE